MSKRKCVRSKNGNYHEGKAFCQCELPVSVYELLILPGEIASVTQCKKSSIRERRVRLNRFRGSVDVHTGFGEQLEEHDSSDGYHQRNDPFRPRATVLLTGVSGTAARVDDRRTRLKATPVGACARV